MPVNNPFGSGGGGGGVWGEITGTLSNQSDLQTALDGKSATGHTHAQSDVTNLVTDLAAKQPLDADLTTLASLVATTNNFIVSVANAWASVTPTVVTALLDTFTSVLKGLVPASGGGTTNFLRADGAWAAPAGGGGTPVNYLSVLAGV